MTLFRGHADMLTGAVLTAHGAGSKLIAVGAGYRAELFGPPAEHGEDLSVRPTDGGRRGDDFRSYPKSAVRSQLARQVASIAASVSRRSRQADPDEV